MHIEIHNLSKEFHGRSGKVTALQNVSLAVQSGEFVCLVGPSGCGKSTLLNMVAGFERPGSGSVTVAGKPVSGPSIQRAMMFQEAALFPWLSARENVEFGLKSLGLSAQQRRERAQEYLRLVKLEGFAGAQPHELSGGMKQRVALARSLAVDPDVLLMDEPFAAVDAQTREVLHEELIRIWTQTRKTILFVTHNVAEAVTLATRVAVLSARPGKLEALFHLGHLAYPRAAADPDVTSAVLGIQRALRQDFVKSTPKEFHEAAPFKAENSRASVAQLREAHS